MECECVMAVMGGGREGSEADEKHMEKWNMGGEVEEQD